MSPHGTVRCIPEAACVYLCASFSPPPLLSRVGCHDQPEEYEPFSAGRDSIRTSVFVARSFGVSHAISTPFAENAMSTHSSKKEQGWGCQAAGHTNGCRRVACFTLTCTRSGPRGRRTKTSYSSSTCDAKKHTIPNGAPHRDPSKALSVVFLPITRVVPLRWVPSPRHFSIMLKIRAFS